MGDKPLAEVVAVDVSTVHDWLAGDQVVLVDVRETSEFDQEHIPGAMLLPMSAFDPELFPTVPGKKVVLHCAVGKRSEAAGKMLLKEGYDGVIHMTGGIQAWKEAGFATEVQFTPHPGPQDIVPPGAAEAPAQAPSEVLCPPPGEVLVEEFLEPLGIDRDELAEAIGVPRDAVDAIVEVETAITAEMSLRLARYFSTAADFWLHLQIEHDLEGARRNFGKLIQRGITPRTAAK
jgi:addiction module HigA family antidote